MLRQSTSTLKFEIKFPLYSSEGMWVQDRVEKTALLWMGHINLLVCQDFRGGFSLVCNKNKEKVRWNMFWLLPIVTQSKEWESMPMCSLDWVWTTETVFLGGGETGRNWMLSGWDHRAPQSVWGSYFFYRAWLVFFCYHSCMLHTYYFYG